VVKIVICFSGFSLCFLILVELHLLVVLKEWDSSQRKVIRYDHSVGDQYEPEGGHGTQVASAAAGSAWGGYDNEADGIATAAKLHVFDIKRGSGKIRLSLLML
jgi:hypothetical protein